MSNPRDWKWTEPGAKTEVGEGLAKVQRLKAITRRDPPEPSFEDPDHFEEPER